jgi:GT2 family glycosyltransferase
MNLLAIPNTRNHLLSKVRNIKNCPQKIALMILVLKRLKRFFQKVINRGFDYSIDSINGKMIYPKESQVNIEYNSTNPIVFKGNIFTRKRKYSIKEIILKIDERDYPAVCIPDSTEAPAVIAYPWKWISSFKSKILFSELGEGQHSLSVKILTKKRKKPLNLRKKLILHLHRDLYQLWIERNEPGEDELNLQRKIKFNYEPTISILVEPASMSSQCLINMINSIVNQTYKNWELYILNQEDKKINWKQLSKGHEVLTDQKKIKFINKKRAPGDSSQLSSLAAGDFISFLAKAIVLAPFALFEIVKTINENPGVEFLYFDEDKLVLTGEGEERFDPHFKPGWAPDTLRSYNYIGCFFIIKKELVNKITWPGKGPDGCDYYDFFLKVLENTGNIFYIPKVLYHQVQDKHPVLPKTGSKKLTYPHHEMNALDAHFRRSGIDAKADYGSIPGTYQARYHWEANHKISIIIPNKDSTEDLEKCLHSIQAKSSFKNFEIIIVDNGSKMEETFSFYHRIKENKKVKIIKWDKPFNYAAVNNYAVNHSEGNILLFLNNDTEVINPDWLERMLEHAVREEVGAVGAKLYYPDNTIQHAGVVIGMLSIAGHGHRYFPGDSPGYFGRLKIIQNVSAVSGACLMTRKNVFNKVLGFDERFRMDFNDIDLCLKIREKGFLIVWTPFTELYHIEMKTRGFHDTALKQKNCKREIELFQKKWQHILKQGDPYYNPNLTLEREDFSLKFQKK